MNSRKISLMDCRISAGFPSPATDYIENTIDISEYLVHQPNSTFILRVQGESMRDKRIFDGDFLVVDKGLNPSVGNIVIAELGGEFLCKELQKDKFGNMYLKVHNADFKDIYPNIDQDLIIWGIVTGKFCKI